MAEETEVQEFSEDPDIDALKSDLDRCRANLSYYLDQSEEARDVRMNNRMQSIIKYWIPRSKWLLI